MKIAVDVTPILPSGECGGATQLVLELLRGLGEKASGDKFILLTAYYNDEFFKHFNTLGMERICILRNNTRKTSLSLRNIINRIKTKIISYTMHGILKKNDVSVLFCPMTAVNYHESGIPTVSIVYDLQHIYYPYFFTRKELLHRNNFYSKLNKRADYVICISEFTKKTVTENLTIPTDRVSVIPISVHSRLTTPSFDTTKTVLTKYNLYNKRYCIYPANFWSHKNHKMLLVAFGIFTKKFPVYNLHLVMTGATLENLKPIEYSIEQMQLRNKVHLLGYLDEKELSAIWDSSYFLVFPSLFEGFGIPLLESMKYKKPIIASNTTSIPEVAGDAAIYFDPRKPEEISDCMSHIMKNDDLYNSLVLKGTQRLKKYEFDNMLNKYILVLHKAGSTGSITNLIEVSGIYDDSWASKCVKVFFNKATSRRVFELKGYIPEYHPSNKIKIKIIFPDGKSKKHILQKGNNLHIKEKLPKTDGILTLKITGDFVPKEFFRGNFDIRSLTFIVKEAIIHDEDTGSNLYEF